MTKRKIIFATSLFMSAICLTGCGNYREIGNVSHASSKNQRTSAVTERTEDKVPEITSEIADKKEEKLKKTHGRNPPETHVINDVPHIYQCDFYPTGCESVSAVSLMNFYGIDITVDEFIDDYLPCSDLPQRDEDGNMYAESPWFTFIGDPRSADSYGCYASVIENAVSDALPDGYTVEAEYGTSLEYAAEEYIANGEPVIIWATIDMKESWQGNSWTVPNGEYFTFICPEHALIFIGYDEDCYYFCDSTSQSEIVSYYKKDCEQAYSALGAQMIKIEMCE